MSRDYPQEHCTKRLIEYRDRAIEHLQNVKSVRDTDGFEKAILDLEYALAYMDWGMRRCPITLRIDYRR